MTHAKKLYRFVRDFSAQLSENSVGAYSAQSAFFIVISYSPFMLVMNGGTAGAAILPALWAASRFVVSIIRGLNKVSGCKPRRSALRLRLLSVLYLLALQFMLAVSLGLLVLGDELNRLLMLDKAYVNMRWVIGFGLLTLFLCLTYRFVPSRKLTFRECLPGAVLAAAGWVAFSWGFSLYIREFADFGNMYGDFAAVVTLMLWMYFCMFIMFAGGQFNAARGRDRQERE